MVMINALIQCGDRIKITNHYAIYVSQGKLEIKPYTGQLD